MVVSLARKPTQGEASAFTVLKISLNSEAALVTSLYTLFLVIKLSQFALEHTQLSRLLGFTSPVYFISLRC